MSLFKRGDYVKYDGNSTQIISNELKYSTLYLILEASHTDSFKLSLTLVDKYNKHYDAGLSSNDVGKSVMQVDESHLLIDYSWCCGGKTIPFHSVIRIRFNDYDIDKIQFNDQDIDNEDRGGLKYL